MSVRKPNGRTCVICGKKEFARGWCHMHWNRWRRHGDPNTKVHQHGEPILDRFMHYVQKGHEDNNCWLWLGQVNQDYGTFSVQGKKQKAHRVSYNLFVGEIPKGLTVDHLCLNTLCVNPTHLEPVTLAVNISRAHAARRNS